MQENRALEGVPRLEVRALQERDEDGRRTGRGSTRTVVTSAAPEKRVPPPCP